MRLSETLSLPTSSARVPTRTPKSTVEQIRVELREAHSGQRPSPGHLGRAGQPTGPGGVLCPCGGTSQKRLAEIHSFNDELGHIHDQTSCVSICWNSSVPLLDCESGLVLLHNRFSQPVGGPPPHIISTTMS